MSFKKEGIAVLRNVVSPQLLEYLKIQFKMNKDLLYFLDNKASSEYQGDEQIEQSFALYSPWAFETLLEVLRPNVEKASGKKLYPTYSYARIYYRGATLAQHRDRPACEVSVTVCITEDSKNPWPIWFKTKNQDAVKLDMKPGDVVVYRGCDLEHWREPYEGKEQIQAFLHYVDSAGPYQDQKFDTRPFLGLPTSFKTNYEGQANAKI